MTYTEQMKAILEKAGGSTDSNLYSEILLKILDALSSSGGGSGSGQEIEAVKQAVARLKKDKIDNPLTSDDDKIPRAKNGGVEWVNVGQPTDEQTNSAVTKWLAQHPEATTTVQDGALDETKFTLFLRQKKASYYKNVSEMKKDTLLSDGMVAVTLGYYEVDDGGGATYVINQKETNKSKINIKLDNDLFANIIIKDKTINVLSAGVQNDGKTPVSDKINNLLKNPNFNRFYFPSGTYLLDKEILLYQTNDITFTGSSHQNENYYTDGSRNNTIFTIANEYNDNCMIRVTSGLRITVEGICFAGNSYKIVSDDNISTTGNIHNMYTETIIKDGISGIIVDSAQSFISNCFFDGFSDNGTNLNTYNNISDCIYTNCRIGLQASLDNVISNIICMSCGTGIMLGASNKYESTALRDKNSGSNIVNNVRLDGMSKHGLEIYGFTNIVHGYLADQINYASVVINGSSNILTNASLSRCAQYSAGNKMPTDSTEQAK